LVEKSKKRFLIHVLHMISRLSVIGLLTFCDNN